MAAIPVPTGPAVKAAIYNLLTARAELAAPVLLSYDLPGTNVKDDIVIVGDVSGITFEPARMVGSGGAGWLTEHYELTVHVDAFRGGDTAQLVDERAMALAAVVIDALRQDPSLGGLVHTLHPAALEFTSEWATDETGLPLGRRCQGLLAVAVHAYI